IGLSLRFPANPPAHIRDAYTRLRPAGLVLPWSSQTGSQAVFSLAPLAAAAWAQSGFCKPISAHHRPVGELQFAWPTIEGKLELPAPGSASSTAKKFSGMTSRYSPNVRQQGKHGSPAFRDGHLPPQWYPACLRYCSCFRLSRSFFPPRRRCPIELLPSDGTVCAPR